MSRPLSANTQAILLLTAPLIAGRSERSSDLLTPSEYKRLARFLRETKQQPADLLASDTDDLLRDCQPQFDAGRLARLLARGFLLSQAVERWQTRAIWVLSRADAQYPKRLKERLKEDAPAVLYGCGDASLLDSGGLAVVGSRNVDDAVLGYAEEIGRLTARANQTLVSGGARGIDRAAMSGALEAGGMVVGVLGDSLEPMALHRENRAALMDGQLTLVSPYDPAAGFSVGNAMQRNKLIYGLADVALVVSSDFEKGGTWAGAVEQLGKLHFVPVYVRSTEEISKGLDALQRKGALPWPDPGTSEALTDLLALGSSREHQAAGQPEFLFEPRDEPSGAPALRETSPPSEISQQPDVTEASLSPADELLEKVTKLLTRMEAPKSATEVATALGVSVPEARKCLQRLVKNVVLERISGRTIRFRTVASQASFLDRQDSTMANWADFEAGAPTMAARGLEQLRTIPGGYLATVRRDGGPRLHPVCPHIAEGRLFVIVTDRSPKRFDLANDGRYALHLLPPPLPPEDPAFDEFELNLTGRARRVPNSEAATWAAVRAVCFYEFPDEHWLFELAIENALTSVWDPIGTPGRRAHRLIWRPGEAECAPSNEV